MDKIELINKAIELCPVEKEIIDGKEIEFITAENINFAANLIKSQ